MSDFVCIDACIAVKWLIPEHDSDRALDLYAHILANQDTVIAPPHMPVEVVNTIRKKARREEITPAEAEHALANFLGFSINLAVPAGLHDAALLLAQRFDRPTVYDTYYVALAEIAGCQMWTADQKLLNALGGRIPFVKSLSNFPD